MSARWVFGISGNVKRPSRTAALVSEVTHRLADRLGAGEHVIELVDEGPALIRALEAADVLVVGSPVYRASYSGALKHLFDLVGYDRLASKPVVLVATGGTPLHGLVPDHQLRPLFAFFRSLVLPTPVYAVETDFENHRVASPALEGRISRVIEEAGRLIEGVWHGEQESAASVAA